MVLCISSPSSPPALVALILENLTVVSSDLTGVIPDGRCLGRAYITGGGNLGSPASL